MVQEYIQVVTTTDKKEDWKNNIETAEEWLCFIKSKRELYDELEKAIKEIHPYETPEIIAIPIVAGGKEYLEWLSNELKR